MEYNELIFPIIEIDFMIVDYLDHYHHYKKLRLVNKYYRDFVDNDLTFAELRYFFVNKKYLNKKFIDENGSSLPRDWSSSDYGSFVFMGQVIIDDWKKSFFGKKSSKEKIKKLYIKICYFGYFRVMKYLWNYHNKSKIDIHFGDEVLFKLACQEGHLEIVKWLYMISKTYPIMRSKNSTDNSSTIIHSILNTSLDKNLLLPNTFLEILPALIEKQKKLINIHSDNECAFRLSCKHGHFMIAKQLVEWGKVSKNPIDIHTKNEYALRKSFYRGHFDITEWLLTLDNKINIHIDNDRIFKFACEKGHYDFVIKLINYGKLIQSPINVRINEDIAFKNCCRHGCGPYFQIAKLLCSLCDKYLILVIGENKFIGYISVV